MVLFKMHKLIYLLFFIIIIYGVYNSQKEKTRPKINQECKICKTKKLKVINDTKSYIINVINNGSNQFDFKGGVMEGGYIPKEDADKVACFVLTLSGKECNYPKDAHLFFTSSCAGCHGEDGKGLNGSYPDLTKDRLLGIPD
jgi:hypothetical protein